MRLVIDSESQGPQPYNPLPPQPGSGILLPLYSVGPGVGLSKDSSPNSFAQGNPSGIAYEGNVESPYQAPGAYGSNVVNAYASGGNVESPHVPGEVPIATFQPWPIASAG